MMHVLSLTRGEIQTFSFGQRTVVGSAKPLHRHTSQDQPNVLAVTILGNPGRLRLLRAVLEVVPPPLAAELRAASPEWTLPDRVILKRQKVGWEDEFNDEVAAYERLAPLQGTWIPVLLGHARHDGVRALVLTNVGGHNMSTPGGALLDDANGRVLSPGELEAMLSKNTQALEAAGAVQGDMKLDNYMRVDGPGGQRSIVAIDLEQLEWPDNDEDLHFWAEATVRMLVKRYRSHLETMRGDGLLPPAE